MGSNQTKDTKMDIGKAIRVALAERDLSQNKTNEKAGLSVGHLNRIIKGGHPGVTLGVIQRIADAMDMKVSELIALGE